MKTAAVLLLSFALACVGAAQVTPRPGSGASKAKAGQKADAQKETPKIEGIEVARADDRGFLGVAIVDATFKISFYDQEKKPTTVDVARAALRWDPKYKVGEERVVLNPSADGMTLTSPRNIRPPYHFKLFITLINEPAEGGAAGANETYVIDFRG